VYQKYIVEELAKQYPGLLELDETSPNLCKWNRSATHQTATSSIDAFMGAASSSTGEMDEGWHLLHHCKTTY
jgi:hypothetical protein